MSLWMVPGRGACQWGGRPGHGGRNMHRLGCEGVHCTEYHTAGLDSVKALPGHCDDGPSSHVLDEAREEGPSLRLVCLQCTCHAVSWSSVGKGVGGAYASQVHGHACVSFECNELEAVCLKAQGDVADKAALDASGCSGGELSVGEHAWRMPQQMYLDHDILYAMCFWSAANG